MNILTKPKNKELTPPTDCQDDQLTPEQRTRWNQLDGIVQHSAQAFYEVGQALAEIRDGRLYRTDYSSWEDYCHARLDFSKRQADRMISASVVIVDLGQICPNQMPRTQSQAQEIGRLPTKEERRNTWEAIVEQHGDTITAKVVKEAVDARLEKERLEKERLEKERLEKERLEKERLEKEKLEKEKPPRESTARGAAPATGKPAVTLATMAPCQHSQEGAGAEPGDAEGAPSPGAEAMAGANTGEGDDVGDGAETDAEAKAEGAADTPPAEPEGEGEPEPEQEPEAVTGDAPEKGAVENSAVDHLDTEDGKGQEPEGDVEPEVEEGEHFTLSDGSDYVVPGWVDGGIPRRKLDKGLKMIAAKSSSVEEAPIYEKTLIEMANAANHTTKDLPKKEAAACAKEAGRMIWEIAD